MSWCYKAIKRVYKIPGTKTRSETVWTIREVFFDIPGEKHPLFTKDGIAPQGSTLKELRKEILMMLTATYSIVAEEKGNRIIPIRKNRRSKPESLGNLLTRQRSADVFRTKRL